MDGEEAQRRLFRMWDALNDPATHQWFSTVWRFGPAVALAVVRWLIGNLETGNRKEYHDNEADLGTR